MHLSQSPLGIFQFMHERRSPHEICRSARRQSLLEICLEGGDAILDAVLGGGEGDLGKHAGGPVERHDVGMRETPGQGHRSSARARAEINNCRRRGDEPGSPLAGLIEIGAEQKRVGAGQ